MQFYRYHRTNESTIPGIQQQFTFCEYYINETSHFRIQERMAIEQYNKTNELVMLQCLVNV